MAEKQYLDKAGLKAYHAKIKDYIDKGDEALDSAKINQLGASTDANILPVLKGDGHLLKSNLNVNNVVYASNAFKENEIILGKTTDKKEVQTSGKKITTTAPSSSSTNDTVPTSLAVSSAITAATASANMVTAVPGTSYDSKTEAMTSQGSSTVNLQADIILLGGGSNTAKPSGRKFTDVIRAADSAKYSSVPSELAVANALKNLWDAHKADLDAAIAGLFKFMGNMPTKSVTSGSTSTTVYAKPSGLKAGQVYNCSINGTLSGAGQNNDDIKVKAGDNIVVVARPSAVTETGKEFSDNNFYFDKFAGVYDVGVTSFGTKSGAITVNDIASATKTSADVFMDGQKLCVNTYNWSDDIATAVASRDVVVDILGGDNVKVSKSVSGHDITYTIGNTDTYAPIPTDFIDGTGTYSNPAQLKWTRGSKNPG